MRLKYANENKSFDQGGWILDYNYLTSISEKLQSIHHGTDLETIEAVLLIAVGEFGLLKKSLEELEGGN